MNKLELIEEIKALKIKYESIEVAPYSREEAILEHEIDLLEYIGKKYYGLTDKDLLKIKV